MQLRAGSRGIRARGAAAKAVGVAAVARPCRHRNAQPRDPSCAAASTLSTSEGQTSTSVSEAQAYIQEHVLPSAKAMLEPYAQAEKRLDQLIRLRCLDLTIQKDEKVRECADMVLQTVDEACALAYNMERITENSGPTELPTGQEPVHAAHLFLQRCLYKVNRLSHFWMDSVHNYTNERSPWLMALRERIENRWQPWEAAALHLPLGAARSYQQLSASDLKEHLTARYHEDVAPEPSPSQRYIMDQMSRPGYCHLLAIGSLDGLVEASRQSRVCAGVANPVSVAVFRVLMEEYGAGRMQKKHSTFYKAMMDELGLDTREEHYLDVVPWQLLANDNHNFLLTERRRHYLKYCGGLSQFEINGPSVYRVYLAAAQRLGLSEGASGYWALHIKEDERHGRQMLEEVALPLVDMFPQDAWEVLWGYDLERALGARAGRAIVESIKVAERSAGLLHDGPSNSASNN